MPWQRWQISSSRTTVLFLSDNPSARLPASDTKCNLIGWDEGQQSWEGSTKLGAPWGHSLQELAVCPPHVTWQIVTWWYAWGHPSSKILLVSAWLSRRMPYTKPLCCWSWSHRKPTAKYPGESSKVTGSKSRTIATQMQPSSKKPLFYNSKCQAQACWS